MRQAIAILEQVGIAVNRRGASGGLYVAAPAQNMVRNSLAAYLEMSRTPFSDLIETRFALTRIVSARAIAAIGNDDRQRLARLVLAAETPGLAAVEAMAEGRRVLRASAGNRPISLVMEALADVGLHSYWMSALGDAEFTALIDTLTQATRRHCLAIIAADFDSAMAAEMAMLDLVRVLHEASSVSGLVCSAPHAVTRAYALLPSFGPAKKGERVAWAIRQRIYDERMKPGEFLGSQVELMKQHGVGRPVLREAIGVLKRLGIVLMRRGSFGGLTVSAPTPSRVVQLARDYFRLDPPGPAESEQAIAVLGAIDPGNAVARIMLSMLQQ